MRRLISLYQPYLSSLALLLSLLAIRMIWHGSLHFAFLVWNMLLALLPLIFSHLVIQQKRQSLTIIFGLMWLIFFPNAAYLLTDIVHLSGRSSPLYWLDLVILFGSGLFGCAVGLRSLRIMEGWWSRYLNNRITHLLTYAILLASGYGIYLGRVERWNSWDILCNPLDLLSSVLHELRHPVRCMDVWMLSGVFAAALMIGHTAFGKRLRL